MVLGQHTAGQVDPSAEVRTRITREDGESRRPGAQCGEHLALL